MTGGELDNCLPPELIDSSSWPWWSRVFGRPPKAIQHLRAEWGKLRALTARENDLPLLGTHGSKIFGNSVCCWDALDHYGMETFSFHEPHLHARRPIPAENRFVSPYGRLVIETRIEAYECDASAIEGIWASKSSEESFASVDEFGEDFCRYKGWGLDMASLKLACRHDQVRIFNSPGIDVFEARAWDGRFFIGNAGGSHHLAAAIHLATRLGVPLPARERLVLFRLNEKTVSWALENFHLIVVPPKNHFEAQSAARVIAGEAASLKLPDRLGNGRLVVFPRSSTLAQRLATELLSKGHEDAGAGLQVALQRQQHFLTQSKLPW